MVLTSSGEVEAIINSCNDRKSEIKAFDDLKIGIKRLVDAGMVKIPRIFVNDQLKLDDNQCSSSETTFQLSVPIIDFKGLDEDEAIHSEIVHKVRDAFENWGVFQVVNHGVPVSCMEEMIEGVREFNEQDIELKKQFYLRDDAKKFIYNTNFDLHNSPAANWRDSIYCVMAPNPPDPGELPEVCRDIMIEYSKHVMKLGLTLFGLISEALGLNPNHLKDMGCAEGLFFTGNYYLPCPEPELTLGISSHTDIGFLTILLQDQTGGLQVLHQNQWVDVPFLPGALIINFGDLLQLITNDRFKSVYHRALSSKVGTRISVPGFFRMHFQEGLTSRLYGPIKELLSEENPSIYKETTREEFAKQRYKAGLGSSFQSHFKMQN